jgi:hypothetical protein
MVNGFRAAAAIFENQQACNPGASGKWFFSNILRITALDRIFWRESRKILSSKDLQLRLSYVL